MAGHSRSKNGVASLAYVPAIHVFAQKKDVDARHSPGMTAEGHHAAEARDAAPGAAPEFANSADGRPSGCAAAPAARGRKRPEPGATCSLPSRTATRPRLSTVSGQPVI